MAAPMNLFFFTCLNHLKTSMYFFIFAKVANDLLKGLATRHNFFAKCEVANAQRYPCIKDKLPQNNKFEKCFLAHLWGAYLLLCSPDKVLKHNIIWKIETVFQLCLLLNI